MKKLYFLELFLKAKTDSINKKLYLMLLICLSVNVYSQVTYTSIQNGNFTDPATWGTTTAPSITDHVIVSNGTTVTLTEIVSITNATINGTLNSSETSPEFTVLGNLIVNTGGLLNGVFYVSNPWGGYNSAIQLSVSGNITNNGRIDLSEGSYYSPEGVLFLNGSTVQTISGIGTFGGTFYATSSSNNGAVINQLKINNTSIATPNVIWNFNNIKIKSSLEIINARVSLNSNKLTIGNYNTAVLSCTEGNGFISGTIGRWYGTYDNFTPFASGSDYDNNNAKFPFITSNGKNRNAFVIRTNDSSSNFTEGELAIAYFDGSGVTSGFSILDGAYTVTDVFEGAWSVSKDSNYAFLNGTHSIGFSIEDAYLISNGNTRIFKTNETFVGNHLSGSTTPFASRVGLLDSDLNNTFLVGYNTTLDTPITSVQSGNWNSPSTWSNNAIPTCSDVIRILSGHTVTVNSASVTNGLEISEGGFLICDSNSLTIGCTNNNSSFVNKGTFTLNNGTVNVNGNMVHHNGSTFNQSNGDIVIDGNKNGNSSTSTDQTLLKIGNSTLNLVAGNITIVDPPVVNSSLVTTHSITSITPCVGWFCFYSTNIYLDSMTDIAVGQIITGNGIPAGTTVAEVNTIDGYINTNPSLPATGLTLPLNISFYQINNAPMAFVYDSELNYTIGENHNFKIGDGISTEKSIVTKDGFNCNFRFSNGVLSLNNLIINALDPINRFVNLDDKNRNYNNVVMHVQNNFTILNGKLKGAGVNTFYGGNIINNGELFCNNITHLGNYDNGNFVSTNKAQTISGIGIFNAQTDLSLNTVYNMGSVSELKVNNTNTSGVTFTIPFDVTNTLTMEEGIIHTSTSSLLRIGAPSLYYNGTINGNFGDNCYIDGPVSRNIGGGQNAANLTNGTGFDSNFLFPVGKTSYNPIWVAVTTTSGFEVPGTLLRVESFDTNSGIPSSNIAFLSQNRWEITKTDGTFTDFDIRVGDAATTESHIIVQAPTANGVYDIDFGITSTFTAGTPNTLTSNSGPLPYSSFKGFISTSRQSECSVVSPGNTITSATTICNGKNVNLSIENIILGEGISYQWQSSSDGIIFTNIINETSTQCTVSPLTTTYYRCNVSCSFSSTTVPSVPVMISLNNPITSTTGATICQPATSTTLSATTSTGTVQWYASQIGGVAIAQGNSFTTPDITTTTTYYVGTETNTPGGTAGMTFTSGYPNSSVNRGLAFDLSNSIILNSVQVHPNQFPGGTGVQPITIRVLQNGIQVPGTTPVVFTPNTNSDWSPSSSIGQVVILNYALSAGTGYSLEVSAGISPDNSLAYTDLYPSPYPMTNGPVSIMGGIDNGVINGYEYNYFFNWVVTEVCSSERAPVTATVMTEEECNLSSTDNQSSLSIIAYPNPYSNSFYLDSTSNSASDLNVKIYDITGRLLENKKIESSKINSTSFGENFPTGIYNVIINQDNNFKSIQLIKK